MLPTNVSWAFLIFCLLILPKIFLEIFDWFFSHFSFFWIMQWNLMLLIIRAVSETGTKFSILCYYQKFICCCFWSTLPWSLIYKYNNILFGCLHVLNIYLLIFAITIFQACFMWQKLTLGKVLSFQGRQFSKCSHRKYSLKKLFVDFYLKELWNATVIYAFVKKFITWKLSNISSVHLICHWSNPLGTKVLFRNPISVSFVFIWWGKHPFPAILQQQHIKAGLFPCCSISPLHCIVIEIPRLYRGAEKKNSTEPLLLSKSLVFD